MKNEEEVNIMKRAKGWGECPDCVWYHDLGGCNVQRDSELCTLNKRPPEEEG